ncbi:MAG: CFI-box-CTERM domain-containing protein [Candidatus Brocadiia bacterium]
MSSARILFVCLSCVILLLACSVCRNRAALAVTYSVTVASEYGTTIPPVGVSVFQSGVTVFCTAEQYFQESPGVRYYCTGWTGSGSAPATGTTNSFYFQILANSSVAFQWAKYFELSVLCALDIPCIPALGASYYPDGTAINLGAPLFVDGKRFDGSGGTGVIASSGAFAISILLTAPSSVTWFYRDAEFTPTPMFSNLPITIDNSPLVGKYTCITIDPNNGFPAVSYFDEQNGYLKYAYFNGANWVIETADSSLLVGQYTKLIFDDQKSPVILYYSFGYADLKIARKDIEGNWYNDIVDAAGFVGQYCDITPLPGSRLGVSYYDATNGDLCYREYQDGFWTPSPHLALDSVGNVGTYTAIATNPITGEPAIAYRNETDSTPYFIYRSEGAWIKSQISSIAGTGYFIDLAFNADGTPFVVFQDFRNSPRTIDVILAQQAGNVWINRVVQSSGDAGFYNSLVIDAAGFPHISYYDDSSLGLRYTFWNGKFWVSEMLDTAGLHVGRFGSLVLDRDGLPQFVYWADDTLRYQKASGWGPVTLTPTVPTEQNENVGNVGGGGGCFIATAAFGSYASSAVRGLCRERDLHVSASNLGTGLVSLYYHVSPSIAAGLDSSSALLLVRRLLE